MKFDQIYTNADDAVTKMAIELKAYAEAYIDGLIANPEMLEYVLESVKEACLGVRYNLQDPKAF